MAGEHVRTRGSERSRSGWLCYDAMGNPALDDWSRNVSGPSASNMLQFPDVLPVKRLLQSVAMLDAVICPEWEYRYYSFDANWAAGETMGSMRNGQGDDFFALFNCHGAVIKGFDHDSVVASMKFPSERFYRDLPRQFASCGSEPAFSPEFVTFCMWRLFEEPAWSSAKITLPESEDSDGSAHLLAILDCSPETYQRWAEEYYECEVSLQAVIAAYQHRVLTEEIVASLNPKSNLISLSKDIAEIGYPT